MKFASFSRNGSESWGAVQDDRIVDLGSVLGGGLPDLKSAIASGRLGQGRAAAADAPSFDVGEVRWLPVIPNPDKILCVGLNYETHRKETGRAEVEQPTIFTRFANSQTGHAEPVPRPKVSDKVDFEGELAVVIGRAGRYIARKDAMEHVAGYSIYNDITIRDFQYHTHQFTPGKNFPGTGAFGPWMVTPDEMGELGAQRLQTRVNGQVVQHAELGAMIFDIARIIEYCSSFTRLEPGDVIATGTPGGVGAKRKPELWLRPGDEVAVEIEGIGTLSNIIEDER